jgi:hypothetical protein
LFDTPKEAILYFREENPETSKGQMAKSRFQIKPQEKAMEDSQRRAQRSQSRGKDK